MTATHEYRLGQDGAVLAEYYRDRSRVSFIMGALGSGKTTVTCQKILKLMCEQEPNDLGKRLSRWYAIRNTNYDLFSTTIKDWLALCGELGRFTQGSKEPPTHRINFRLPDGTEVVSEMIFIALDREDSIKRLRGAQLTGVWLNEVKELIKGIIDMADLRHGRYPSYADGGTPCTWHGILGDTNAPPEGSWYYQLAEISKPKGWSFFRQPPAVLNVGTKDAPKWIVNPKAENINNLPDGYYQNGLEGKDEDWVRVNLANEYGFVRSGKPVYPEYRDFAHCKEITPVKGVRLYRGWDFGLTPACVIAQITPNGRFNVIDEMGTKDAMGIARFSDDVLQYCAVSYKNYDFFDVADPAGEQRAQTDERTCFDILRGKGIQVKGGIQNLNMRLESVKYALNKSIEGAPIFALHPRCQILRNGFMGGYHYRKMHTAEERYSEQPEKNEPSHKHDALQYICAEIFGSFVTNTQKTLDNFNSTYSYTPKSRIF